MSRLVTIASGKSNVLLPNGATLNAGQTSVLTDAEFAKIVPSLFPGTVIDGGSVVGADDQVITKGTAPAAVPAQTSAASAAAPTKTEFDKTVADITALRTSLVNLQAALTGAGKALN